ncbi:MAG TPA: hypothetical protein DCS43_14930 [Verrucomicrobia bacterium]|nr:hypothetical protein [Verrucomicrobiota bacterium]
MIAILDVLAGLAVFVTGMNIMSSGLQHAAGDSLRRLLERATHHPLGSLALGSALGMLIQSSAATVMLVGFISAGLMTLAQSIPLVLGINIGTTLSMLMFSFKLGDVCWLAITAGLLLRVLRPAGRSGALGVTVFGFGLIFLGLNSMSAAIRPFRSDLAGLLLYTDGATFSGLLSGVALATLITAVIQSSGAVIGMVFAMITAGAMTGIEQAWPIIIGANIGTCTTALLGSIHAPPAARRSAVAHLVFNLFSAIIGMASAPLIYRAIPLLWSTSLQGADPAMVQQQLIQQCALANVLKMAVTALFALPFTPMLAALVTRIVPGTGDVEPPSLLDRALLTKPEAALQAALQELSRITGLCRAALRQQAPLFVASDARLISASLHHEELLDTLKLALHSFLESLTKNPLLPHQSARIPLLYAGIDHLERISDHTARMAEISRERHRREAGRFTPEVIEAFMELNQHACTVLTRLQQSLSPAMGDCDYATAQIMAAYEQFAQAAEAQQAQIASDLSGSHNHATAAIYRTQYLAHLRRLVNHARQFGNT